MAVLAASDAREEKLGRLIAGRCAGAVKYALRKAALAASGGLQKGSVKR
jgi:hypothetical protein